MATLVKHCQHTRCGTHQRPYTQDVHTLAALTLEYEQHGLERRRKSEPAPMSYQVAAGSWT